ncbi:MAG TPA: hypothetical protein VLZ33_04500, partial [Dysgonamonadaceae bacterium]|nr:hypothetical protein [Dysgonamonadaceae bacterium]
KKESNPAFYPQEMLRSYKGAQTIFEFYDAKDNLSQEVFDTPHGYLPEIRETMLGWFDLHLKNKGSGASKKEKDFILLSESDLRVFPEGGRYSGVMSTAEYCLNKGVDFKQKSLSNKGITAEDKKEKLRNILRIPKSNLLYTHKLSDYDKWERFILETTNGDLIPVLLQTPNKMNSEYVIICNAEGKDKISKETIDNELSKGKGVCIIDLWGVGENSSDNAKLHETRPMFFNLARSALWLGKTTQGIWVNELKVVSKWLQDSYNVKSFSINANKEAAIAGLLFSALENRVEMLYLKDMPLSYLFDNDGDIDYFSMAIHIPDILKWGDISLAAALSSAEVAIINPLSISGRQLNEAEVESYKNEFNHFNAMFGKHSSINISR